MANAIILVIDSFGIGASDDADTFGDQGANTLLHIAQACADGQCNEGRTGPLTLPNLSRLGLGLACELSCGTFPPGLERELDKGSVWGYAREISTGKDTPSGHWEMAGVPVLFDWGYFPQTRPSFPDAFTRAFIQQARLPGILGNCHGSGTEILQQYAEQHIQTSMPICYTSGDSVFQIAAHEEHFGLERLYHLCEIARTLLDELNIGRVIARPFTGNGEEGFTRTHNRRDFSIPPPQPTLLNAVLDAGGKVTGVGKVSDIFAGKGLSHSIKASGTAQQIQATLLALEPSNIPHLIFTNLVDFDTLYGHRRDIQGYGRELEKLDGLMPDLLQAMSDDDILIITADHGCDPSWPGTDHTREHVPLLCYSRQMVSGSIGARQTFADIAQTLCTFFNLSPMEYGTSFLPQESPCPPRT